MTRKVAVIGGGLAGIAAALACADAGRDVILLEARGRLGGLTYSFRRDGLSVDNGQHVFLRCCTAYLGLLDRLGVAGLVSVQPRLDIPVRSPGRPAARLRRSRLPAPLHLAAALLGYRLLTPADRLRAVRAALALRSVDPADPVSDQHTFGGWLSGHGQNDQTIAALWNLFAEPTLNASAAQATLSLAAMTVQTGLLSASGAGDIGWARVPLQQLHGDPAEARLREVGATVRTGTKVTALEFGGGRWTLRIRGGQDVEVDEIVLAVPPAAAERLLPAGSVPLPAGWAGHLGAAPILNLHVVYDRRVLEEPFIAAVGSPVSWIFDRTASAGLADGQYLALPFSAAEEAVMASTAQLRERMLPALAELLPEAGRARVLDFFVSREREATFRQVPGSAAWRPATVTAAPGLTLAGAWTATGWPATMEGAVRSGNAAAAALLHPPARAQPSGRGHRLPSGMTRPMTTGRLPAPRTEVAR